MDNFIFGFTMAVVGIGGTMLSLWFLTLIIDLLKRLLPAGESNEKNADKGKVETNHEK